MARPVKNTYRRGEDSDDCPVPVCSRRLSPVPEGIQRRGDGDLALRFLGVTFYRLLHVGAHCSELRGKVTPRIAHLRRMTDRSWGLNETQSRMVANGYVRGALQHAEGTWLPPLQNRTWSSSTASCKPQPVW